MHSFFSCVPGLQNKVSLDSVLLCKPSTVGQPCIPPLSFCNLVTQQCQRKAQARELVFSQMCYFSSQFSLSILSLSKKRSSPPPVPSLSLQLLSQPFSTSLSHPQQMISSTHRVLNPQTLRSLLCWPTALSSLSPILTSCPTNDKK